MGTAEWAFTLSVLSFIWTTFWSIKSSIKSKQFQKGMVTLESFKDLYSDILLKELPQAKEEWDDMQKFSGKTKFYEKVRELRKNSVGFKMLYPEFYVELESELRNLEDQIGQRNNLQSNEDIRQNDTLIKKYMLNIYDLYFKKLPKIVMKNEK